MSNAVISPEALLGSRDTASSLPPASSETPSDTPVIGIVKAALVRTIMASIMLLTGAYVGVDWAMFFHHFASTFPADAGYARSVMCFLLVLLIGPTDISVADRRYLGAAFVVTLLADYFLILTDKMTLGTAIFLVVHGIYIARHAQGIKASFAPAVRAKTIKWMVITGVVAYGATLALIVTVKPILVRSGMFALDCVYLGFLSTSLWMAWGTLIRSFYPRYNAWMIAVGMTFFYCCDVSVGLSAALNGTDAGAILNNMVGLFYTPALVLLAFSGFRWLPSPKAGESHLGMSGRLAFGISPR